MFPLRQYYLSNPPLETKTPVGNSPGRRIWEVEMATHLCLVLSVMAILGLWVKITIDRKWEFGQSWKRGWPLLVSSVWHTIVFAMHLARRCMSVVIPRHRAPQRASGTLR